MSLEMPNATLLEYLHTIRLKTTRNVDSGRLKSANTDMGAHPLPPVYTACPVSVHSCFTEPSIVHYYTPTICRQKLIS